LPRSPLQAATAGRRGFLSTRGLRQQAAPDKAALPNGLSRTA
jgi:hypothetical protein